MGRQGVEKATGKYTVFFWCKDGYVFPLLNRAKYLDLSCVFPFKNNSKNLDFALKQPEKSRSMMF